MINMVVCTIANIIGIIFMFINPTVTVICAIISLIYSFINIIWGEQNGLTTEILAAFIGLLVALFADLPIIPVIAFAINIEGAILSLIGIMVLFFM